MLKSENRGFRTAGHLVLGVFSLLCIIPFLLLFIASFTDEKEILLHGYSFFPGVLSTEAYRYLLGNTMDIGRAYGVTIFNIAVGTTVGLTLCTMLAYALSRKNMPFRSVLMFVVLFTMLFNGGMVPSYMIYTMYFHIKNTIFAQIVPGLLLSGFNIMLVRSFFSTSIPGELIESAKIDGAGEFMTFRRIVIPMSLPILATVGLLQALMYSNDWNNGLLYISNSKLYNIQNMLNQIMMNIQFLASTNLGEHQNQVTQNIPGETIRMAMATIAVVPVFLAYPFFQKNFVKGITIGAVKG